MALNASDSNNLEQLAMKGLMMAKFASCYYVSHANRCNKFVEIQRIITALATRVLMSFAL